MLAADDSGLAATHMREEVPLDILRQQRNSITSVDNDYEVACNEYAQINDDAFRRDDVNGGYAQINERSRLAADHSYATLRSSGYQHEAI